MLANFILELLLSDLESPSEPGMESLKPQMDLCRKGIDPLKLLMSLFSQSVDGVRRQHLIDAVVNGPLGPDRGMKFHPFHPLWKCHCDLVSQSFPLHLTKGQRTFLILKKSSRVSRGYTHTEGAFRPARTHLQRDPHDADGLFGYWRIPNVGTLKVNSAPLEAFRGL